MVQRTLEDEREPKAPGPFRHVWHGVVGRLRRDKTYVRQFNEVFTVLPTQDAVGQALATYMRTILAGNSLHDRVMRNKKGALAASDYEALLDAAALKALGRPTAVKAVVASDLLRGWTLFTGKAGCIACHPASNGHFSDSQFYNIGVGEADLDEPGARSADSRSRRRENAIAIFAARSRRRPCAAWRGRRLLPHRSDQRPGGSGALARPQAAAGAPINLYLDPKLADPDGVRRDFGLGDEDIATLVVFLKALNGEEVDRFITLNPN